LGVDVGTAISVPGLAVLGSRSSVRGWYSGTAKDAEDTAKFSAQANVKVMTEIYPFDQFKAAYDRMMTGKALFRVVLAIAPEPEPAAAATARK
jgi:D-arabinose 1-dehydrogenase-like Zn-dependent alcohol dehydrogenase